MTELLRVFVAYVVVTFIGLVVAKVLIQLVVRRRVKTPVRPARQDVAAAAAEVLKSATELRMDATAFYDQLCGKV